MALNFKDMGAFVQKYGVHPMDPEGRAIQAALDAKRQAAAANRRRMKEITRGHKKKRSRIMGRIENFGQSERDRINRDFTELDTTQQQDLISRGLSTTTVQPTVQAATQRERSQSLTSLEDALMARKAQADERLTNQLLDMRERITDAYPDTSGLGAAVAAARRKARGGRRKSAPSRAQAKNMSSMFSVYNTGGVGKTMAKAGRIAEQRRQARKQASRTNDWTNPILQQKVFR